MKKFLVLALTLGLISISSSAFAAEQTKGIAVVDVQKVVMNSAKVKQLELDRIKQEKDLQSFILKAKQDVDAEKDANKKKALEQKYNKELNQKLLSAKKDVVNKTQAIEKNILQVVQKEAKAMGYEMVIQKNSVLYGGDDITDKIINAVK